MPITKITLPNLHDGQIAIKNDPARFKVISAGRRYGKTRMLALIALAKALEGGAVLWVAPSYQIGEVGWRLMRSIAGQIPGVEIRDGEKRISLARGWVQVRSADSQGGLRGEGLDLVIFDEAAHIRDLQRVWEQEIRPALSDRKGGAYFISTPKGFGYFYELFKMGEMDTDWKSFHAPSADNPFLDPAEIEAARLQLPALVFRQEYLAEFVQLVGAMFRREYFNYCESVPSITQVRHWDLAASTKTQADYSVGCKGGMDDDGNVYITDIVRGRWEWPALIRIIRETALSEPGVMQSIETAGTQKGLLDLLMAEPTLVGVAFAGITPTADKITRAQPLLARAEQNKLYLLRANWNAAFVDECCAFPEVEHDDQIDGASGMLSSISVTGWAW